MVLAAVEFGKLPLFIAYFDPYDINDLTTNDVINKNDTRFQSIPLTVFM